MAMKSKVDLPSRWQTRRSVLVMTAVAFNLAGLFLMSRSLDTTERTSPKAASSFILFSSSPAFFADRIADCMDSDTCHILYQHVQKTGGSNFASRLFPIIENSTYNSSEWCCNQKLVSRFELQPHDFCSRKLGVYEVTAPQYQEIVATCRNLRPSDEYLPLISIREPIQRTISMINHQCNKNFEFKNETEQAICKMCRYTRDTAWFWKQFVDQTNTIYLELEQMLTTQKKSNQNAFLLDSVMIDPFLKLLGRVMEVNVTIGKSNKQKTHVCNFGMTSAMMKDLLVSQMIYRNLVGGYMN
jgi:Sulfotransferase family